MRGYLQQLIARTSRPEHRLRPFLGSIYAADSRAESVEVPPVAERWAEPAAADAVDTYPTTARSAAATLPSAPSSAAELRRFAPLLHPDGTAAESATARGAGLAPDNLRARAQTTDSPAAESAVDPQEPRVTRVAPRLVPLPAVERADQPAAQAGAPPSAVREVKRMPAAAVARRGSAERVAPANAPAPAAGADIQVHIGRIEVVAVAPAQRPASAPASRSTSLNDYLKSRSGRTR